MRPERERDSAVRPSSGAAAPAPAPGTAAGAVRGRASVASRVPSEKSAGSDREKMEESGGGGAAGTGGDGGAAGEQLLTVKHELRTGERPRPLPAWSRAGARPEGSRGRGARGRGGASRAGREPRGVPGGRGAPGG